MLSGLGVTAAFPLAYKDVSLKVFYLKFLGLLNRHHALTRGLPHSNGMQLKKDQRNWNTNERMNQNLAVLVLREFTSILFATVSLKLCRLIGAYGQSTNTSRRKKKVDTQSQHRLSQTACMESPRVTVYFSQGTQTFSLCVSITRTDAIACTCPIWRQKKCIRQMSGTTGLCPWGLPKARLLYLHG